MGGGLGRRKSGRRRTGYVYAGRLRHVWHVAETNLFRACSQMDGMGMLCPHESFFMNECICVFTDVDLLSDKKGAAGDEVSTTYADFLPRKADLK